MDRAALASELEAVENAGTLASDMGLVPARPYTTVSRWSPVPSTTPLTMNHPAVQFISPEPSPASRVALTRRRQSYLEAYPGGLPVMLRERSPPPRLARHGRAYHVAVPWLRAAMK